jgi:hypothetical protein
MNGVPFMIDKIRRFCQGHFRTVLPLVVGIDVTPVVVVVDVAGNRAAKGNPLT